MSAGKTGRCWCFFFFFFFFFFLLLLSIYLIPSSVQAKQKTIYVKAYWRLPTCSDSYEVGTAAILFDMSPNGQLSLFEVVIDGVMVVEQTPMLLELLNAVLQDSWNSQLLQPAGDMRYRRPIMRFNELTYYTHEGWHDLAVRFIDDKNRLPPREIGRNFNHFRLFGELSGDRFFGVSVCNKGQTKLGVITTISFGEHDLVLMIGGRKGSILFSLRMTWTRIKVNLAEIASMMEELVQGLM